MSINLIAVIIGGGGLIWFVVWIIRGARKFGRQDRDIELLSDNAESMDVINEMERIQDEKDKGPIDSLDDAIDFVDGLPDDPGDR